MRVHKVFVYITERCNLGCDYCYFRDKRGRLLRGSILNMFVDFLYNNSLVPGSFEISGGEALTSWDNFKGSVACIRRRFANVPLGVQTNGLLLNSQRVAFLKKNRLRLEIGIDGDYNTTFRHRRLSKIDYVKVVFAIRECLKQGIDISCTMTVHPSEVDKLYKNFAYLVCLGLNQIDITPAAFMRWDAESINAFKKDYLMVAREFGDGMLDTTEDKVLYGDSVLDLSLHPSSYVFCGDAYLCLPENKKNEYRLFTFGKKAKVRLKALAFFLKEYKRQRSICKGTFTCKDYINSSFRIIEKITRPGYLNAKRIIELHDFCKEINLGLVKKKLLSRKDSEPIFIK